MFNYTFKLYGLDNEHNQRQLFMNIWNIKEFFIATY